MDKKAILKVMERGQCMYITDKFARHIVEVERDEPLRAYKMMFVGIALGETLGSVECPTYWERFLRRKDCPQYMKEISIYNVSAYYPKLSLPEEKNWVTFESPIPKDDAKI